MRIHLSAAVAVAAALLAAAPAYGQAGNASDVTGPNTTGSSIAGNMGAPSGGGGTVSASASPAVAAAVGAAAASVSSSLSAGSLTTPSGVAIPAAAQASVLAVLTGSAPSATLAAAMGGGAAAQALAEAMSGLISSPDPGQLAAATGHFNAMVLAADASFLANPPAEFLAVMAVLSTMVGAANSAG